MKNFINTWVVTCSLLMIINANQPGDTKGKRVTSYEQLPGLSDIDRLARMQLVEAEKRHPLTNIQPERTRKALVKKLSKLLTLNQEGSVTKEHLTTLHIDRDLSRYYQLEYHDWSAKFDLKDSQHGSIPLFLKMLCAPIPPDQRNFALACHLIVYWKAFNTCSNNWQRRQNARKKTTIKPVIIAQSLETMFGH